MRQVEKHQQSRETILRAAIAEFGGKGYAGASLNALLSDNGLSKGLAYHYFENKDQLYLACVTACFDALMAALTEMEPNDAPTAVLHTYFETRGRFFHAHPMLERIFFDVMLQPPSHLEGALTQIRTQFDSFNRNLFHCVLGSLQLRKGIDEADALSYFSLLQSALHLQLRTDSASYEARALQTVELLLYGLAGGERPC